MKSKTLVLMVIAVGCGLVASYMTSKLLADRGNKDAEEEKVTVLVAKKNLTYGLFIKEPEQFFVEKQYSVSDAPKNAIASFDEVKNVRLNKPIGSEHWITKEDLLNKDQANFEIQMPPGTKAVAIEVNARKGVAGFVQPNSKVDVIWTSTRGNESTTCTILQNMLVLAVDQKDQRDTESRSNVAQTVTVAAKPDEAQKLSLARSAGEIDLVLRKVGDEETVSIKPVTIRDLFKTADGKKDSSDDEPVSGKSGSGFTFPPVPTTGGSEKVAEVVKEKKTETMVIYNGAKKSQQVFVEKDGETTVVIEKSDPETGKKPEAKPAPAAPKTEEKKTTGA